MAFHLVCPRIMANASERCHVCDDSENGVNDRSGVLLATYESGSWRVRAEVRGQRETSGAGSVFSSHRF